MHKITHRGIIALRAPSRIENSTDLPTRLVMLKWGDNETTQGPVKVGERTLSSLSANQARLGFDEIALDFNHNTVPGHPSNKGEPAFIAATAEVKVHRGEGLVFENVKWTDKGKEHVGHYPDLSPAVQLDDNGEVIFCHSGALCRQGAVKDLHVFSVSFLETAKPATETTQTIVVNKNSVDLDRLRKILNLSADATIEDINRALVALDSMSGGDLQGLAAQIKALAARFDNNERTVILDAALRAGKVVPQAWLPNDKGEGGLPNDQLRALCATLPEVVPLDQRTPERLKEFSSLVPANPAEEEVRNRMGLTKEQWTKYN